MIKALYTAASGLVARSIKQDVIANNLANAMTPGFKRERVVTTSFRQALDDAGAMAPNIKSRNAYPYSPVQVTLVNSAQANDLSAGAVHSTGNMLNFAIDGPGAFEVESNGTSNQTRNGTFIIDTDGELATSTGGKVQGNNGPITMPEGKWSVTDDGTIIDDKGNEIDQIKINNSGPNTRVMQGYLEDSNVSSIREMIDMISNMRSYEANQRVVSSVDSTLDKLVNEVGKV